MKKRTFIFILAILIVSCFADNVQAADFYVISGQNKCSSCSGTISAGGRWCDNGNGTVTDMTTCLVWLKYADWGGEKPWRNSTACETCYDDARNRASALENGDLIHSSGETIYLTDGSSEGDWRLPTLSELDGITEGGETVISSNMQFFEGVQPEYYWSSTTHESFISNARVVNMVEGIAGYNDKDQSDIYVWPVRSGN